MLASQWVWQRTKSVSIPAEEQNAGCVVDYFYRMEFHITPRFFSDSNYLFFFCERENRRRSLLSKTVFFSANAQKHLTEKTFSHNVFCCSFSFFNSLLFIFFKNGGRDSSRTFLQSTQGKNNQRCDTGYGWFSDSTEPTPLMCLNQNQIIRN